MNSHRHLLSLAAGLLLLAVAPGAVAQTDYPSRPVRMIVPWVAGGGTDILARILSVKLTENLGQPIIIDNRPGVNGVIGSALAAKATPDGHTMILEAVEHVINASTYAKLPYDTLGDFAPVGLVAGHSLVLVVHPSFPPKSLRELIALAKSKPSELSFGSWGEGSLAHLSGEMIKNRAAINMVHVPYKGAPQAVIDVIGGRLSMVFTTMPIGIPAIKSGKARPLAVTSAKRLSYVPEVPTMIESGYPGFEVESWRGMYLPAGSPKKVIARLNSEFVRILQIPDIKDRVVASGFEPMTSTPEELDKFGRAELAKWAKVAKTAGVRIE